MICPRFSGVRVLESGGVVGAEGALLVLGWGEHAKGGVATAAVVKELDVVVDRGGQLDAGLPGLAIGQFDLQAAPEGFDSGPDRSKPLAGDELAWSADAPGMNRTCARGLGT